MNIRTWLAIQWPFSVKTRLRDTDRNTVLKLARIATNLEALRNVR